MRFVNLDLLMKQLLLTTFILCFNCLDLYSQTDTLIVYDVRTKETNRIDPPQIDSFVEFDHTDWNLGSLSGVAQLSQEKPTNTPPNSGFTDLVPAHSLFDVSDYPIRTAVKLFRFTNDSLKHSCSGTMVANNLVLTSAHCLYYDFGGDSTNARTFRDSILAVPAYDNKMVQPQFGSSVSSKYYMPKTWYDSEAWDDIALIELNDPIGTTTGWVGLAFSADSSFFPDRVFHKFSYPASVSPYDSTKVFNGDTLYYNYGTLDVIRGNYLGFNLGGIPGQSGSSLLYTDNAAYYVLGTLHFSVQSRHYRIEKGLFYALARIISDVMTHIDSYQSNTPDTFVLSVFPNPTFSYTNLVFEIAVTGETSLKIYNILGQEMAIIHKGKLDRGKHEFRFRADNLAQGVYFAQLRIGNNTNTAKIFVLR